MKKSIIKVTVALGLILGGLIPFSHVIDIDTPAQACGEKEIVILEDTIDENTAAIEEEIIKEEIRLYWRNLALNIEQKKERTLEEIYITEKKIDILKSNIDYYLINGYKADLMILDLRYLEGRLPPLFKRLELIEEEKEQLRYDARKQGVPPGYLRP